MKLSFIIIDDRELDCYIAEKIIQKTGLSTDNKIFYDAFSGLNFIKNTPVTDSIIIVLLDIMMPVMNGFQFMEAFEKLPEEIKNNYRIVAITTSLNKNDISEISSYKSVIGVLKKPYPSEALVKVLQIITGDLGQ
ncbi:response regulator [Pedobacter arcticus]|uniref:response regulator n=1 Tax=Pedobacter arcticus TaxID=752140 RepID=UPI0002DF2232|nr:response regulator [Pedobacter arcticus]